MGRTDVPCMQRLMVVVVVVVVTGCGAYMSAGIDTGYKISGGLAQPMKQTMTADPRVAAARASAGLDATSTPPTPGKTYTLSAGVGTSMFQVGLTMQAHDVDRQVFSLTDMSAPRYATATASLDVTWTPLRWRMLSTFVHAGPSYGVLLERTSGNHDTGKGLRFGGGIAVSLSVLTAYVDFYQMELQFASGPAQGMSQLTGATVGIGFNR